MNRLIPYGHRCIDEDDIQAVVEVLRSEFVGAEYRTAVSSGTAALHTAVYVSGIKPGDDLCCYCRRGGISGRYSGIL